MHTARVGVPIASAVLALVYPTEYCVIDFRGWRQVFEQDRRQFTISDYKRYLVKVRELSRELQWPVQEVDLAVWEYDSRQRYGSKVHAAERSLHSATRSQIAGGSGCAGLQADEPGTVVSGEFTADDCYAMDGPEREPVDAYRFTVPEQRDVHAVVEAPGLDVQFALVREDGTVVKTQPYDGSFTSLFVQVPAGAYRITLRSLGAVPAGRLLEGC